MQGYVCLQGFVMSVCVCVCEREGVCVCEGVCVECVRSLCLCARVCVFAGVCEEYVSVCVCV